MSSFARNYYRTSEYKIRILGTIASSLRIYIRNIGIIVIMSIAVCLLWFMFAQAIAENTFFIVMGMIKALNSGKFQSFPNVPVENFYNITIYVFSILVISAAYSSVISSTTNEFLHSSEISHSKAIISGLLRSFHVFVLNILFSLLLVAFVAGVFYMQVILAPYLGQNLEATGFLFVAILIIGIFIIFTAWSVAIPNTVIRQMSPVRSIGYSFWLISGNRLRMFVIFFIIGIICGLFSRAVDYVPYKASIDWALAIIVTVLCMPISLIAATVIYRDLYTAKG